MKIYLNQISDLQSNEIFRNFYLSRLFLDLYWIKGTFVFFPIHRDIFYLQILFCSNNINSTVVLINSNAYRC